MMILKPQRGRLGRASVNYPRLGGLDSTTVSCYSPDGNSELNVPVWSGSREALLLRW